MRTKSAKLRRIRPEYIAARNPSDRLWYCLGHCGDNQYMQVHGNGYNTRTEAVAHGKHQLKADKAAALCVAGAESVANQLD